MYSNLTDKITKLLFHADPIKINFQTNTDEYKIEAKEIVLELENCKTVDSLLDKIYDIFVKFFNPCIAGTKENYRLIAENVWNMRKEENER